MRVLYAIALLGLGICEISATNSMDWWQSSLIYQIYTRSFMDNNGDGIGDIRGITGRLNYLKDLSVDAIWLSPIFKTANNDFGYDVTDYFSIDDDYGTMDDFEKLIRRANELNIKVILEFVPNHTSNESDWFVRSIGSDEYYSDWYIWESGYLDEAYKKKPPTNWMTVSGKSAWTYIPKRDQFYFHQFHETQPDLNLRNPVVVDELKNAIKFWLEKGVAGMSLSSVNHFLEVDKEAFGGRYPDEPPTGKPGVPENNYEYLDHIHTRDLKENFHLLWNFREAFDSISVRDNMTRVMLVEASDTNIKNSVNYYDRKAGKGAHIPVNFGLIENLEKGFDTRDLKHIIDVWMTYKPPKRPANWMTGNHDTSRVATRLGEEFVDAFNMLVLLLPGIGLTYMGEELGMRDSILSWSETKDPLACRTDDPVKYVEVSRDPVRTPFLWSSAKNAGFSKSSDSTWLPIQDGYELVNVENEKAAVKSHLLFYKTLSNLRKRNAFRIGRFESVCFNNEVFGFKRWHADDTYVMIMNIGKTYHLVNLTAFDLVFGQLEVEASSILSHRNARETLEATNLEVASGEALVLRMMV